MAALASARRILAARRYALHRRHRDDFPALFAFGDVVELELAAGAGPPGILQSIPGRCFCTQHLQISKDAEHLLHGARLMPPKTSKGSQREKSRAHPPAESAESHQDALFASTVARETKGRAQKAYQADPIVVLSHSRRSRCLLARAHTRRASPSVCRSSCKRMWLHAAATAVRL